MKDGTHWWIRLIEMTLLKSPKRRENLNITIKQHHTECAQHNIHFPFTVLWPPNKRGIQLKKKHLLKVAILFCSACMPHFCFTGTSSGFVSTWVPLALFLPSFSSSISLVSKNCSEHSWAVASPSTDCGREKKVKCSFELGAHYPDKITPAVSS